MATVMQRLSGFNSNNYTLDKLIEISEGKYLKKYNANTKTHLFLFLNPSSARLYTLYDSKDGVNYKVRRKMKRGDKTSCQISNMFKVSIVELDKIIADSDKEIPNG